MNKITENTVNDIGDSGSRVVLQERKSAVLTPSTLSCLKSVPTVNLTQGCNHGCAYCYSKGYRGQKNGEIVLYSNTLEKMEAELMRKRVKPSHVYFSPSTDFFQPVTEVLDMGFDILSFLYRSGVGVSILTKGEIPRRHMDLMKTNADATNIGIGLITLDEEVLRDFEPKAAPALIRLDQMKELRSAGVAVQCRLDPILPNLTDDKETLEQLVAAIAKTGVKDIAASVLFLRPAISAGLKRTVRSKEMLDRVLSAFEGAKRIPILAGNSSVTALPSERRKEILDRVKERADEYGIKVHICACKNSDLADGKCKIDGSW